MTQSIVFALVGLALGGTIFGLAGALAGAALGLALGSHLQLRGRIDALEAMIERLERGARNRAHEEHPATRPAEPRAAPIYEKETSPWTPPPREPLPAPRDWRREQSAQPEMPTDKLPPQPADPVLARSAQRPRTPDRDTREAEFPGIVDWILDWFLGGNLVVRVGVVVLFLGVGFLLKFAVDRNMLPIELRLAGAALGGAALLVIGWRLRARVRPYALALQGGGVGLLYLTAFAALRFYHLLPPTMTFALLVVVAAISAFLAIGQDALVLAALGGLGGYLAPILTSTGQGDHVVLFSFYALLDAGIVAIAWFKAWRPLNLQAFVFTYGIGSAWGVLRYSPEQFASTEPFVILFFLMFLAVAVLFALRTAPKLTDYVDGTLVFGTPVMTMLLQSALVRGRPYALAFSALTLGAVYLLLARAVWRRGGEQLRLLAEAFLALGIAFVTLAVPLALDGHWTAGSWALEGAAIFWIGVRQERGLAIASGLLLQLGAAVSYAVGHDVTPVHVPLANSECVGALLIAAGGIATARVAHSYRERLTDDFGWLAAVPLYWALGWWAYAGVNEILEFLPQRHWLPAILGFAVVTALGYAALSGWGDWRVARTPTLLLLPVMLVMAAWGLAADGHLLAGAGIFAWPLAFAAWFWVLRWRSRVAATAIEPALHLVTLWFVVASVTHELTWQVEMLGIGASAWHRVVSGAIPALALMLLIAPAVRARWPVSAHSITYPGVGAAGLALYLWTWVLVMNLDDAGALPLPYLPIANPVELVQGFGLASIAGWLLYLRRGALDHWLTADHRRMLLVGFVAASFMLANAVLLRIIHHLADIPYTLSGLTGSTLVQAALSIFWGALALACMVFGTRRAQRTVWFAGASLLGVALAKMFIVDLSRTGTVARIVSFIGVGILMLVIGRFSPVPPALTADGAAEKA